MSNAASELAPELWSTRRSRRRRTLAAVVLVALLAGAMSAWWFRSLNAYEQVGYGVSGQLVSPGASLLAGVGTRPASGVVTLIDVEPVVLTNTADADLQVVVCDKPEQGQPPGVVRATAAQYCGRPVRVEGYEQSAIQGGEAGPTARDQDGNLVLQITPRRVGTVEVSGVKITYRVGLRRQTQFLRSSVRFASP